jgi:myosin protein heavy chain
MSLKLEYTENCGKDSMKGNVSSNGNLNQSIEALNRKMENIGTEVNEMDPSNSNQEFSSKILGLESRIEHVALATFTNLRLLDKKVEHMTTRIQSALDGATMADKKCVALGFELVKVFRMFSCKQSSQSHKSNDNFNKDYKILKMSQSFKKKIFQ